MAYSKPGTITRDCGHYLGVLLDSESKKRIRNYHPTWEMQYGEMAEELPLKQFEGLTNGMYDWDDVKYMLGDARHYVRRVWAATRTRPSIGPIKSWTSVSKTPQRCSPLKSARPDLPALPASQQKSDLMIW
ncbi:hypothetical protein [Pseudomonas donghuensis]|uniref:hypothetical protein n=1 Tax=Pseudomonas TaxID=286 RepID=UPI003B8357C7|nr:hypothetical protein [Pseudomonas vranovensis]